jgi:alpha-L-rhamnosidase
VGDLTIWLFESVAGIQSVPEKPGFEHIRMKPHPVGDLTSVRARFDSIRGPIESRWERKGKLFSWDIEIPANTTATVFVPTKDARSIQESGRPATERASVHAAGTEGIWSVFEIGSGKYTFQTDKAESIPVE